MEFCDNCGKPLIVKNNTLVCNCGFEKSINQIITKENIKKPEKVSEEVLNENKPEPGKGFPFNCDSCGYKFADVVDLGVSYSDESNVTLFRCRKCKKVQRNAFGSSIG